MKTLLGIMVASMVIAGAAPARATAPAPPPVANKVFDFSGTCTDCSGTASAELTLAPTYTLGDAITPVSFVSFHYDGTDLKSAYTLLPGDVDTFGGAITNVPGGNFVLLIAKNETETFNSLVNGLWHVANPIDDFGTNATWVAGGVPEPATWAMLLAGFAGLGLVGRRGVQGARSSA